MNAWEIVLIIACVLIVLGVIVGSFVRKKKGKSSCCSECSSCPYANKCADKSKNKKNKD